MTTTTHWTGCGWFWAWALVGVGFGFGISVIGIFTIPVALVAVVFMSRRRPIRGAWGVATGVGSVLLFVAYNSWTDGTYNTGHWLVAGLVPFVGGMIGHALTDAAE
ncbi:MAG TPA: hypothetical protein VGH79_08935 [Gaiellaceae bacterium]|jgi:hypothetical protein